MIHLFSGHILEFAVFSAVQSLHQGTVLRIKIQMKFWMNEILAMKHRADLRTRARCRAWNTLDRLELVVSMCRDTFRVQRTTRDVTALQWVLLMVLWAEVPGVTSVTIWTSVDMLVQVLPTIHCSSKAYSAGKSHKSSGLPGQLSLSIILPNCQ